MATEPYTKYKVQVVIQNSIAKTKCFTDPDQLIIDKNTGETLAHKLKNLDVINRNIAVIADKINSSIDTINSIPMVSPSEINGNILIDNKETNVYTPDRSIVRYGEDLPSDTTNGEVYMVLLGEDEGE